MQPIQIRVNAAVVLVVLLLAVPLQLFLSHYLAQVYTDGSHATVEFNGPGKLGPSSSGERTTVASGDVGASEAKGIEATRKEAANRLVNHLSSFFDGFYRTAKYYSSWSHLKELVVIPYRKRSMRNSAKITLRKSKSKTELVVDGSGKSASSRGVASKKTGREQLSGSKSTSGGEKVKQVPPTSRATEVEDYLFNNVYFSHSKEPRTVRPKGVEFHIGQVIKHKQDNYHGVIIGWDLVAKAPDEWKERHYSKRPDVINTPHYLVLVDSHFDASGVPYHYLPQEDISPTPDGTQVRAPEIDHYFEGYKDNRHLPRPWLRHLYPRDQ